MEHLFNYKPWDIMFEETYKKVGKDILSEKVNQAEREEIRKDKRFRIGIEYEMELNDKSFDGKIQKQNMVEALKKAGFHSIKYFDKYHGGASYKGWRAEPDESLGKEWGLERWDLSQWNLA
jgi:hypothetical protein